jgi:hypothetical protein
MSSKASNLRLADALRCLARAHDLRGQLKQRFDFGFGGPSRYARPASRRSLAGKSGETGRRSRAHIVGAAIEFAPQTRKKSKSRRNLMLEDEMRNHIVRQAGRGAQDASVAVGLGRLGGIAAGLTKVVLNA